MKLSNDTTFDRLYEVAVEGLSECDRSLLARKDVIKAVVSGAWEASGDQQRDYEALRSAIGRESDRISARYEEHLAGLESLGQNAVAFDVWIAQQYGGAQAPESARGQVFRVYHLEDTRSRLARETSHNYALLDARRDVAKAAAIFREPAHNCEYRLVAEVRASSLDDVFRLTNTIESYWWDNPEVQGKFKETGCRSTSVGDIVFEAGGAAHLCASIGWEPIDVVEPGVAPQSRQDTAELGM